MRSATFRIPADKPVVSRIKESAAETRKSHSCSQYPPSK